MLNDTESASQTKKKHDTSSDSDRQQCYRQRQNITFDSFTAMCGARIETYGPLLFGR